MYSKMFGFLFQSQTWTNQYNIKKCMVKMCK